MNSIDPFSGESTLVVGEDNPLYGCYKTSKLFNKHWSDVLKPLK